MLLVPVLVGRTNPKKNLVPLCRGIGVNLRHIGLEFFKLSRTLILQLCVLGVSGINLVHFKKKLVPVVPTKEGR